MSPNESVQYDLVRFPIESDELYDFLETGSLASFHATKTRDLYGLE
jgi:hypothetical protein